MTDAVVTYEAAPVAVAGPVDWEQQADVAIAKARAFERIKSEMLDSSDYDLIQGKKVPNQKGVAKLGVPCGHSTAIISRDENGEPGVRRSIVENLKGDRELLYTVTVRVTDMWNRFREQSSSFSPQRGDDDNKSRAMCEKRASKKAAELLVGGVSDEPGQLAAKEQAKEKASPTDLIQNCVARLIALGEIESRDEFKAYLVKHVPGCESAEAKLTIKHGYAVAAYLKGNFD